MKKFFNAVLIVGICASSLPSAWANSCVSCSTYCQRFDAFSECTYMTKCEWTENCVIQTTCTMFDHYNQCISEKTTRSCYFD